MMKKLRIIIVLMIFKMLIITGCTAPEPLGDAASITVEIAEIGITTIFRVTVHETSTTVLFPIPGKRS